MKSAEQRAPRRTWGMFVASLVLIVFPVLLMVLIRALQGPDADVEMERMGIAVRIFGGIGLAVLASVATLGSYLLVFFTACFTFRFDRPVYAGFKKRLLLANTVVPLMATIAMIGAVDVIGAGAAVALDTAPPPWWTTILTAIVVTNMATTFLAIWSPVETRLIEKRLAALGVGERQLRTGLHMGIADPARSAWKKAVLEDDIGMFWLEPGRLTYRGDVDEFSVTPAEVADIERVVVKANLGAYLGLRHIVLALEEGRRIRLHVESEWTLSAVARATDRLADRLTAWKARGMPQRLEAASA